MFEKMKKTYVQYKEVFAATGAGVISQIVSSEAA